MIEPGPRTAQHRRDQAFYWMVVSGAMLAIVFTVAMLIYMIATGRV